MRRWGKCLGMRSSPCPSPTLDGEALLPKSKENTLDSILRNCSRMRNLQISPEAAQVLDEIESAASQLMRASGSNMVAPTQEQAEWMQLCPRGGRLVHTHVCVVTRGRLEDMFMGRLYVGECGIAVQETSGMFAGGRETALNTGFLSWDCIESMEIEKSEVQLHFCCCGPEMVSQELRLQLGSGAECTRLKQYWFQFGVWDKGSPGGMSATFAFHSFSASMVFDGMGSDQTFPQRQYSPPFMQEAKAPITASFLKDSEALPTLAVLHDKKPLCSRSIEGVTLESVQRLFEQNDNWFLCQFQAKVLQGREITATPWTEGQLIQGTQVRRVSLKVPSPEDVPKAVAKVIGFPPDVECSLVARLHCTDSQVALVMQSCSLNVPYGDCQKIEDVIVVTPDGDGAVKISKWIKMVFLKMPFAIKVAKGFLESQLKIEGQKTFDKFVDLIEKLAKES